MRRPETGFSLIELLMYVIVVGVALAGLATLYVNTVVGSHEPLQRERARTVATSYLEEVLGKPWNENSPAGGGCVETGSGRCTSYCAAFTPASCPSPVCLKVGATCTPAASAAAGGADAGEPGRADYDDVDDFDGLSDCPPADVTGSPIGGLGGFCASVAVGAPAAAWNGLPAADTRLIEVTVTTPGGEPIVLHAYRLNF